MGRGDKGKNSKGKKGKAKQTKVARELKYQSGPGGRSSTREAVPADISGFYDGDGEEGDGSAGVREPRNPKPQPLSSAGARPMPRPEFAASTADPRH